MALDFPTSPTDGQIYDNYYWDDVEGVWNSLGNYEIPNLLRNGIFSAAASTDIPLTIQGATSQSANLQEWTDSTNAVLASMSNVGNLSVKNIAFADPVGLVPTGAILPFAGSSAPSNYLLCNGGTFSSIDYPALATVLGDTYGVHSSNTYYLPDLRQRVPVGKNTGTFATLGGTGGTETVTLTGAQSGIASHNHGISDPGHNHTQNQHRHTTTTNVAAEATAIGGYSAGAMTMFFGTDRGSTTQNRETAMQYTTATNIANTTGITVSNVAEQSASQAHNNLQPYIVVNYIIKT